MGYKNVKKVSTNRALGRNFSEIIIPVMIITSFVIFGGVTMVNREIAISNSVDISESIDIWEEAFKKVEKNKVGITFENILTSNETYTSLRIECNKYIEQIDKKPDIVVDVDTTIEEDMFVDISDVLDETIEEKSIHEMENPSETGPIYFNNKILIRYINGSGELKIVAANIDNETGDITVSNKQDLYFKLPTIEVGDANNLTISENEYLSEIKDITIGLIKAKTMGELSEYQKDALNYFTLDGSKTVLNSRMTINKDGKDDIEVVFIEAGKSSLDVTYKDTIYMQIKTTNSKNISTYGVILKLNRYSRIFDIDII